MALAGKAGAANSLFRDRKRHSVSRPAQQQLHGATGAAATPAQRESARPPRTRARARAPRKRQHLGRLQARNEPGDELLRLRPAAPWGHSRRRTTPFQRASPAQSCPCSWRNSARVFALTNACGSSNSTATVESVAVQALIARQSAQTQCQGATYFVLRRRGLPSTHLRPILDPCQKHGPNGLPCTARPPSTWVVQTSMSASRSRACARAGKFRFPVPRSVTARAERIGPRPRRSHSATATEPVLSSQHVWLLRPDSGRG
jgi:hypothetical protein